MSRLTRLVTMAAGIVLPLTVTGCSNHGAPNLARECDTVFGVPVTKDEGVCTGSFRPVAVFGVDCPKGGARLMLAKTWHGDDYAWGRVGSQWHFLTTGQTMGPAFEACIGQ